MFANKACCDPLVVGCQSVLKGSEITSPVCSINSLDGKINTDSALVACNLLF